MKILVKLKWSEGDHKWHLITPRGAFLYDLFNCANMQRLFDSPDKEKEEMFVIDVYRLQRKI